MQNILFGIRSRPFFLLLTAFLICTIIALSENTFEFEKKFMGYVQSSSGNTTIDLGMWLITESGNVFVMLPFSAILLIIRRTRRIGMTLLILIDRPFLTWEGTNIPIEIEPDSFSLFCDGKSWTAGFPSGHASRAAMFAFVLSYVLSERFPRWCNIVWLYPIMIAFSRVYVLQHYPLDVIGGTILGIFLAGIVSNKLKLHQIFDSSKT